VHVVTQPADRRGRSPGGGLEGPPTGLAVAVAVLLAVPLVALMWVSSYNKAEPRLGGVPFFYWYQFLWVFIAAACTTVAYRLVMGYERRRRALRGPDARGDRSGTGGRR
jgi:Protein of unknown function (DUF3311)